MARKNNLPPDDETRNDDLFPPDGKDPGQGDADEPKTDAGETDFKPAEFEHAAAPPAEPGPDPFDPESLRLTQDLSAARAPVR
jgi:hypothetical protein